MQEEKEVEGDSTKSVHSGQERFDPESGAVSTPIYQTSTFGFNKTDEVVRTVDGESKRDLYTRWGNPTVRVLESKIAGLEGAEEAAAFSSGVASITTTFLTFVSKGDHVVAQRSLYGEAFNFVNYYLPNFGVEVTVVDTCDYEGLARAIKSNTKFVYVETPTNPTLRVVDLKRVSEIVHERAITAVDGTFGSPINQKPISLGIDLSIHSATKYLNGHSDVIAGVVSGRRELVSKIKLTRRVFGGTLDPHAAWLVIRGCKTLALRVKKQNENAMALANFLRAHPSVSKVNYPGLETNPDHEVAKRQMPRGYGGVLSFEVNADMNETRKVVENLKYAILGASLGGVETLVTQPATTSHHQLSRDERLKIDISDSLIRVAVGIEDSKDLINDFDHALGLLRKKS